jgi:hypothetical protein
MPLVTLHEQTGMSLIRSHIKKLTKALYQKSAGSENKFRNSDNTTLSVINICVPCRSLRGNSLGRQTHIRQLIASTHTSVYKPFCSPYREQFLKGQKMCLQVFHSPEKNISQRQHYQPNFLTDTAERRLVL